MNRTTTITIDWVRVWDAIGWVLGMAGAAAYSLGEIADILPPWLKRDVFIGGVIIKATATLYRAIVPPPSVVQLQTTPTPVVDNVSQPLYPQKPPVPTAPIPDVPAKPAPCPICEHQKHIRKIKNRRKPRRR